VVAGIAFVKTLLDIGFRHDEPFQHCWECLCSAYFGIVR